jgi:hypothetical protein
MSEEKDIEQHILRIAQIVIDELRLEDVTSESSIRIWIWLTNWGSTAMDLATWRSSFRTNTR